MFEHKPHKLVNNLPFAAFNLHIKVTFRKQGGKEEKAIFRIPLNAWIRLISEKSVEELHTLIQQSLDKTDHPNNTLQSEGNGLSGQYEPITMLPINRCSSPHIVSVISIHNVSSGAMNA